MWVTGEEDTDRSSPIRLLFELRVDLYARRTWGEVRDNQPLADASGGRLAGFLRRIGEDLGGQLMDVDAPSYRDQVGPLGFS